jgi:hypothetical protein
MQHIILTTFAPCLFNPVPEENAMQKHFFKSKNWQAVLHKEPLWDSASRFIECIKENGVPENMQDRISSSGLWTFEVQKLCGAKAIIRAPPRCNDGFTQHNSLLHIT